MDFLGRSDRMGSISDEQKNSHFQREEKACCFHYIASIKVYSNLVLVCLVFCTIRIHSDASCILAYTIVCYNRSAMVAVAKTCTYVFIFLYVQEYLS